MPHFILYIFFGQTLKFYFSHYVFVVPGIHFCISFRWVSTGKPCPSALSPKRMLFFLLIHGANFIIYQFPNIPESVFEPPALFFYLPVLISISTRFLPVVCDMPEELIDLSTLFPLMGHLNGICCTWKDNTSTQVIVQKHYEIRDRLCRWQLSMSRTLSCILFWVTIHLHSILKKKKILPSVTT